MPVWLNVVLQLTWCLPQSLLSALVYLCLLPFVSFKPYRGAIVGHLGRHWGAITLGWLVLTDLDWKESNEYVQILNHEIGHSFQSLILGWLFVPVVSLPSLIHALWFKFNPKANYYAFYTERWASKLGSSSLL